MLMASALHGAELLGRGESLRSLLLADDGDDDEGGGHQRLRLLLSAMLSDGVPLLVATGAKNRDIGVERSWRGIHGHLVSGSLLVLMDETMNIIGLAQPMGRPVYVAEGGAGFLPTEVRHALDGEDDEALTCLQLWVRLLCVADYAPFSRDSWCGGGEWSRLLNWDLRLAEGDGGEGFKTQRACNASSILPVSVPVTSMFKARLTDLSLLLCPDFDAKLSTLRGPVTAGTKRGVAGCIPVDDVMAEVLRRLNNTGDMVSQWRRGVLVRELLQHGGDPGGAARHELRCMLPDSLLGPPCHVAEPLPPVLPVCCGALHPPRLTAAQLVALVRRADAPGRVVPSRKRRS